MKLLLLAPLVIASAWARAPEGQTGRLPASPTVPVDYDEVSIFGPPTQQAYLAALIRQPFFDKIVSQGVDLVSNILTDLTIPETSSTTKVPLIGNVKVDISHAKVLSLSINPSRSSISLANDYISVGIGGLSLDFRSDYKYKQQNFPKLGGHGTGHISVRDATIAFDLRLRVTQDGALATSIDRVYTTISKLNVEIEHGTAKWLLNLIFNVFSGLIKNQVTKQIETQIQTRVPTVVNKALANLNLNRQVSSYFSLDAHFAGDAPIVKSSGLILYDYFAIGSLAHINAKCPYAPQPTTAVATSLTNMIVASVHESTLNCALWAIRDEGKLAVSIDNSQLPPGIAILETDSWEEVFPGLAREYPHRGLQLNIKFNDDIKASVVSGKGIKLNAAIIIDWVVIPNTRATMVTEVKIEALLVPTLVKDSKTGEWKLKIDLAQAGPTRDDIIVIGGRILSTEVYPVDEALFDETLNDLAPIIVSVLEDNFLKAGFSLPIPDDFFSLTAAQVVLTSNQVNIGADINIGKVF